MMCFERKMRGLTIYCALKFLLIYSFIIQAHFVLYSATKICFTCSFISSYLFFPFNRIEFVPYPKNNVQKSSPHPQHYHQKFEFQRMVVIYENFERHVSNEALCFILFFFITCSSCGKKHLQFLFRRFHELSLNGYCAMIFDICTMKGEQFL